MRDQGQGPGRGMFTALHEGESELRLGRGERLGSRASVRVAAVPKLQWVLGGQGGAACGNVALHLQKEKGGGIGA